MFSEQQVRDFYTEVGRRVRDARNSYPMTQETLGRQLGLTRSSIANIEAGRQRIQLHLVVAISTILDVDLHTLTVDLDAANQEIQSELLEKAVYEDETARDFVRQAMMAARKGGVR